MILEKLIMTAFITIIVLLMLDAGHQLFSNDDDSNEDLE